MQLKLIRRNAPMHSYNLITELELYFDSRLITEEERPYSERFMSFIQNNPNCFERTNRGHITGSAWIVNYEGTHALLTHHKKLNIWVQLGGHADGNPDIKAVALQEAEEESGITGFEFVMPGIFDIDIHPIPGPCEFHYDVRYVLRAPKDAQFIVSGESHDLAWVELAKVSDYSKERSVVRMAEKYKRMLFLTQPRS